jgi:hypothetical protein
MAVELHTLDPNGDLLMQLFRQPAEDLDSNHSDDTETSKDPEPNTSGEEEPRDDPSTPVSDVPAEEAEDEIANIEPVSIQDDLSNMKLSDGGSEPELEEVKILASSRHMALASPVFRSMLDKNKFSEGRTLHAEGSVQISFPDDDPDAFLVLLNVIHGLTRAVDRHPDLNLLTELAILVDKYHCLQTVEVFAEIWIDNLLDDMGLPVKYTEDVIPWVFISWVFESAEIFQDMTRIIQLECDETLDDDINERIPIPELVISECRGIKTFEEPTDYHADAIKASRNDAIERATKFIYNLIAGCMTTQKITFVPHDQKPKDYNNWRFARDAVILGSLIKGAAKIGIWPELKRPYCGIVFSELTRKLRGMQIFNHCDDLVPWVQTSKDSKTMLIIDQELKSIKLQLCGLQISDLSGRS